MRRFKFLEIEEAIAHALEGGQALHLHRVIVDRRKAPACFVRAVDAGEDIAHLFDQDELRLIATVRKLGDLSRPSAAAAVRAAVGRRRIDLVVGGIPCEQVSIVRATNPIDADGLAAWHALIDSMCRLALSLSPRWWCFEDVLQVEPHLPPQIVLGVPYRVVRLDSADYQPQRRVRTFLGSFPDPAPPEPGPRVLADVLRPGPWTLDPKAIGAERMPQTQRHSGRVGRHCVRILDPSRPSPTVLASMERGSRQRRAFTIELADGRLRTLTLPEAALLQGFPEDFVFVAPQTRAWKMLGQAIPITLGRALLQAMLAEVSGSGKEE